MDKIEELNDLGTLQNEISAVASINENNNRIEEAFANTLSRDGTSPNDMEADFNLNGNDILNGGEINAEGITANTVTIRGENIDQVITDISTEAQAIVDQGTTDVQALVAQANSAATRTEQAEADAQDFREEAAEFINFAQSRTIHTLFVDDNGFLVYEFFDSNDPDLVINASDYAWVDVSNIPYGFLNTGGDIVIRFPNN